MLALSSFVTWIIFVAVALLFAVICSRIATSKGRSTALWAVLGFLFPLIALIIVLVLPQKSSS